MSTLKICTLQPTCYPYNRLYGEQARCKVWNFSVHWRDNQVRVSFSTLIKHPKVVATPHLVASTKETQVSRCRSCWPVYCFNWKVVGLYWVLRCHQPRYFEELSGETISLTALKYLLLAKRCIPFLFVCIKVLFWFIQRFFVISSQLPKSGAAEYFRKVSRTIC